MQKWLVALTLSCFLPLTLACATNLGTGSEVMQDLTKDYPITVGQLVKAHLDPSKRLRLYLQICQDAGPDGPVCSEEDLRILAMVESHKEGLLQRLVERYLEEGKERPIYVYGPMCEGLSEMILVPRCQTALAIGIWDPVLRDYIVYSTLHGTGSFLESDGFDTFIEVTRRASGLARTAAKVAH
jgi:hypothetical protein